MRAAQIVERHVEAHGRQVAIDLFREAIAQPRKPLGRHAQRQIRPFNVAGRNMLRLTLYGYPLYGYYLGRRIAARRFGYVQVGYAVGFIDDAVRGALAESVT